MSLNINDVFDANFYRAANPSLAGLNDAQALSNFQTSGLNQGLSFSPLIDLNFYKASNADLANLNNSQLLDHLENHGVAEGRSFSPVVDLNYYHDLYSDLKSFNNEQLFNHLKNNGITEGRFFDPLFSFVEYKSLNSDLTNLNNSQLLNHFEINGLKEGRDSSPYFDFNYYRANNKDLANLNNSQLLQHFEINGLNEGRSASPFFDAGYYKANNPDVASLKGMDLLEQFDLHGNFEGRQAASEYAGNTLNTARQLTIGSNYTEVLEHVGSSDPVDYYQFSLNQASTVTIYDYGFSRSVGEQILDSTGSRILTNRNSAVSNPGGNSVVGTPSQSISLNPGTYYIAIQPQAGNTDYNFYINAIGLAQSQLVGSWTGKDTNNSKTTLYLYNDKTYTDMVTTTTTPTGSNSDTLKFLTVNGTYSITGNTIRFDLVKSNTSEAVVSAVGSSPLIPTGNFNDQGMYMIDSFSVTNNGKTLLLQQTGGNTTATFPTLQKQ